MCDNVNIIVCSCVMRQRKRMSVCARTYVDGDSGVLLLVRLRSVPVCDRLSRILCCDELPRVQMCLRWMLQYGGCRV